MMRKGFVIVAMLTLLLPGLLLPVKASAELTETEVSESLLCYACPGEPLSADRCPGGDQMRDVIKKMLQEGKSKEEILDYFAAQFGDSILTTVPKKGFNLVAYTGPFIALLIGIPLAIFLIRRWNSAGEKRPFEQSKAEQTATLDDEMRRKIDKELSELDEED
jgi:cytochrome c-type biogenesis protein CcmH